MAAMHGADGTRWRLHPRALRPQVALVGAANCALQVEPRAAGGGGGVGTEAPRVANEGDVIDDTPRTAKRPRLAVQPVRCALPPAALYARSPALRAARSRVGAAASVALAAAAACEPPGVDVHWRAARSGRPSPVTPAACVARPLSRRKGMPRRSPDF